MAIVVAGHVASGITVGVSSIRLVREQPGLVQAGVRDRAACSGPTGRIGYVDPTVGRLDHDG